MTGKIMANHVKPTKEELKAAAAAAAAKVDAMTEKDFVDPNDVDPIPPTPPTPPTPPVEPTSPATPTEPPADESTPPTPPVEPTPPANIDYKKRYSDATREAQVVSFKNKEINEAVDEAALLTEPEDEEMIKEYPEWEEMTATEQRLAKGDLLNKRRFELVHAATNKFKAVEDWNAKVDTFTDDPKTLIANPDLEGKQDEFRRFASKPTRRGVDFDDLVLAFFGEEAKRVKPNHQGESMFPAGSGGSKETIKPPSDKLTLAQGNALRKSNYPEYRRMLKAGKIENE